MRVAILAVLLISLTGWLYLEHIDPRYHGRRTSEWLLAFDSKDAEEVKAAKSAIFQLGEKAVPQISRLFFARDDEKRNAMFAWINKALGVKIASEDADSSRRKAIITLEILGERAAPMLPELIHSLLDIEMRQYAWIALGCIGKPAIVELKKSLKNTDPLIKVEAIRYLVASGETGITPELKVLVKDKSPALRAIAIEGLTALSPSAPELPSLLINSCKDDDGYVRAAAVRSLGYLSQKDTNLLPSFFNHVSDTSVIVRLKVAEFLGPHSIKDKAAADALLTLLADSQVEVRAFAIASVYSALVGSQFSNPMLSVDGYEGEEKWQIYLIQEPNTDLGEVGLLLSRSDELEPLLQKHLNSLVGKRFEGSYLEPQAKVVKYFLKPACYPYFKAILSEVKKGGRLSDNGFLGYRVKLSQTSNLPNESWQAITPNLREIYKLDPVAGEFILDKLLRKHGLPQKWEASLLVP
jgi:hypothetical protein